VILLVAPVASLVTVTAAPGIAAPVLSVTVPAMSPEIFVCAMADVQKRGVRTIAPPDSATAASVVMMKFCTRTNIVGKGYLRFTIAPPAIACVHPE
jgi:hypothetical protein